ncbi:MAG: hypothetical protein COW34_02595 [Armatimonadetes bacterium CG17_big_fil_post_rev_8_21_14_2_50_66_6]|nr:MAG: hypothetical protein COW34_02595 [Armatimonadetes bacterium CG17_big_fil_post_rev_8_21_14_2_50_66_6]
MTYTIAQAAQALGESERTVRRRVDAGELSVTTEQRGGRDMVVIDGAELARYAATHGRELEIPALTSTARQIPAGTDRQQTGTDRQAPAHSGAVTADLAAEVARLRAEREWQQSATADLRDRIRELQTERDWLREKVDELTRKALPAETGTDRQAPDRQTVALTGTARQPTPATTPPRATSAGLWQRLTRTVRTLTEG